VSRTQPETGAPWRWLALTALVTAAMLVILTPRVKFDTNFYSLWEATNLLAGDHPYRDFFEWGIPLQAVLSAVMQSIVGYRMIGEFILLHWTFIIAGAVISFDLGYRLTRSIPITVMTALIALAVLPDTPTYHYPKLFVYPAAIWLAWRYMERPGVRDAAALGLLTAVAFLFRHDHGVYVGVASVIACVLVRATVRFHPWRQTIQDAAAYCGVAAVVVLPWAVLVQTSGGLTDYVKTRAELYEAWSGEHAYASILQRDSFAFLDGWFRPPAKPGVIALVWDNRFTPEQVSDLEQRFGLRRVDGKEGDPRRRYAVADVNDVRLYGLRGQVDSTEGIDWDRLQTQALNSSLPAREPSRVWQAQITMIVPLLFMASALFMIARSIFRHVSPPPDALRLLVAGATLAIVDAKLLREVSYAHLVAPVTAALGGYYLRVPAILRLMDWMRLSVAGVVLIPTIITAVACMGPMDIFGEDNRASILPSLQDMTVSPPIDTFITRANADRIMAETGEETWQKGEISQLQGILMRYVHDCTAEGDRVLVSGSTPYHVGYAVHRPVAGGHVFWHHRWLADPPHEARILALLQRQSVPFALSTHDPVLGDLEPYPSVHRYIAANYEPLPGSRGVLLVDKRRVPTGTFGPFGFPCFK
jgi:hypothetical protein